MGTETARELIERAMAALEIGDRNSASDLLKEAVEADPDNLEAWTQLSKVLTDRDEQRIALTTILQLDPQNAYARAALVQAEKTESEVQGEAEVVPGITRREARTIALGLGVFTLVMCGLVFFVVTSVSGTRAEQRRVATQEILAITQTRESMDLNSTVIAQEMTDVAQIATETAQATITPTLTPSRTPDLPPTFTPSPTVTQVSFRVLDAPPALPGNLYTWGGINPQSDTFLSPLRYALGDARQGIRLNSDLVQNVTVDVQGTRLAYIRQVTGGWVLMTAIAQSPENTRQDLSAQLISLRLAEPVYPRLSADSNTLVFQARDQASGRQNLYVVNLVTGEARKITADDADYSMPTVAPDGGLVVAVKDAGAGPDLVLINLRDENLAQIAITQDGDITREALPSFAPDGIQVVYSAATSPGDHDLYLFRLSGTLASPPVPVVTTTADEIHAHFDPESRFLVYASNATSGIYNLFIHEIGAGVTYQLTEDTSNIFPGGWSR